MAECNPTAGIKTSTYWLILHILIHVTGFCPGCTLAPFALINRSVCKKILIYGPEGLSNFSKLEDDKNQASMT